jgi:uncharacterized protein
MNNQQKPLNNEEFDRLGDFLEENYSSTMNLEMLDGFFSALICGPDLVFPSKYLPEILGEDYIFDSDEQAVEIIELLMRHWNTIASELLLTLDKKSIYLPILFEDENGVAHGNDWAQGFMRGVQLHPESWYELINDEECGGAILPIMILYHENDLNPTLRPPAINPEKRDELLQYMIAGLTHIYRYFAPHRQYTAEVGQAPWLREQHKVGRNERCPCGSGRKYKYCCAVRAQTIH